MTESTRGTLAIPEAGNRIVPSSTEELDQAVAEVRKQIDTWRDTGLGERIRLLEQLRADTFEVADDWVRTACEAKGIGFDDHRAGEEWMGGPVTLLRNLRLLQRTLEDIRDHGRPQLPGAPTTRPDGVVTVPVFPTDRYDRVLFAGYTAEVWMADGVTEDNLHEHLGLIHRPGAERSGGAALVLGAGNVSSIGPMDVLYKLFAEDEVVVLKMNPVNEHLGPFLASAFRALVDGGFLRIVYGGAEQGGQLTTHEGIDSIHITGSDKTHDAIVWGPGEEGRANKQAFTPRLDKPITSELGNVTPVIVVPGPWSGRDVRFHAENIVTHLANNAGFNCIASRVIVQHARWNRRRALLDEVRRVFASLAQRPPYYPGARDRWERFTTEHPGAECFGPTDDDHVPWTLIPDLDARDRDALAFNAEAFNGIIAETALDAPTDVPSYLEQAVELCNESLWGTLAAVVVVHPRTLEDPDNRLAFDRALARLRYGTIVVNHFSGLGYGFVSTPWGAYPGHTLDDIQSGRGVVHNTYLLDRVVKSVVRGPFTQVPKPAWFVTHRRSHDAWRAGAALQADPSPARLAPILWAASRP